MKSSTTSRWSAAGRPGSPPPSMRPPKGCRSPCSMPARSAARPAPAPGSRTISAFPTGISGQALAGRAFNQAQKFGARDADPGLGPVARLLAAATALFALATDCGQMMRAKSVVVASGARYRRPEIENLDDIRGPRRLVLGLADRGAAVRRPGGRAGRRRQFRRPGRGVPVRPCAQGLHDGPRRRPRRQHVALSDRAHRGDRPTSN